MALSRSHTFVSGELLTASNLNGIETNIINNPISLVSPTTGAINFASQAHSGLLYSAITPSAPRLLQCVGTMSAGANITTTTPTTVASQAITPSSTNSRIKVMISCAVTQTEAVGSAQAIFTLIATSSGTISNTARTFANTNITNEGIGAGAAWTFLHQSTGPYPLTYAVQGFSATSTIASPYGSISGVNIMLEELSS